MSSIQTSEVVLQKAKHNFHWLDLIRGLASLEVCFSHLRALFFVPYAETKKGVLLSLFYFLTGFSHESVIIFFVLSGFLISRNVHLSFLRKTWSAKNYAIDRLIRLWIVVIPGLILTVIVDHFGLEYFSTAAAYSGGIPFLGDLQPMKYFTMGNFFGNVFFLQTILVSTFGSNIPLWSLSCEFWYYVLFPLLYFSYVGKRNFRKIVLLLMATGVCFFIGRTITLYFLAWLVGFAVMLCQEYFAASARKLTYILTLVAAGIFLFALVLIRSNFIAVKGQDFVIAVISGVLVYGLINIRQIPNAIRRVSGFLSGISYSLYVIHFPIAVFLSAFIIGRPGVVNARNLLFFILAFLIILMVVTVFWYLFESRYPALRTYIKGKLSVGRMAKSVTTN